MCGIAGWLDFNSSSKRPELLKAMTDLIYRRGPDGEGYHIDTPVHLGHRRLSIIDVAGGSQPISNEDESVWIVFNGEIYNFQEIRSKLKEKHQFKTRSDTEVIVHAYEEYGLDFVNHLRGQFAFAIWDKKKQQLVLARDRMGQKPLYYCELDNGIVFGSELKALLKHPDVKRDIDLVALDAYLAHGFIPEPLSIFQSVRKLLPAHVAVFDQKGLTHSRYWKPGFKDGPPISENEALEQLDSLVEESVRLRMISEVPLGAFLSGGIDSSLVVAYMSRVSDRPIKTFNIGFEEQSHDERPYAQMVAEQFKTEHQNFVVRPDAMEIIPELVQAFDEPFADSSALAVYYLSKMTREHVVVALNGDGGDESFAGYRRYGSAANFYKFRNLPSVFRKASDVSARMANKLTNGSIGSIKRFARWSRFSDCTMGEVYQMGVTHPVALRNLILGKSIRQQLGHSYSYNGVMETIDKSDAKPFINQILEADQRVYLPGDLLVKVDRATMWHSLEGRSPFLDHKLVEFAAGLSGDVKFPKGQLKHLLKKLSLKFFPEEFVYRKKMGFAVPLAKWFRHELKKMIEETIADSQLVKAGYLDDSGLNAIYQSHLSEKEDHSGLLWSILMLEHWFRSLPE